MSEDDYDDDVKRMVYEIHGDVKKINQHLDSLNGKVERHQKEINDLGDKTKANSKKINIGVGIAFMGSAALGAAASYMGGVL